MFRFVRIPIHPEEGITVALRDILEKIPTNDLLWRVLHFTGVGKAPDGMTMPSFERAVRASPDGYHLTWSGLLNFANEIEQVWDCLIVGTPNNIPIQREIVVSGVFLDCDYVIEADDSTDWKLGTKNSVASRRVGFSPPSQAIATCRM